MGKTLEVHIAGNGIGESIALKLPDGTWGVIDVYVPTLADPQSSAIFRLLEQRRVSTLKFLCLTHPDSDHFRGMSHFLKRFQVEEFWTFGAISRTELYQRIATVLKAKALKLNAKMPDVEDADDFHETLRLVSEQRRKETINIKQLVPCLTVYEIPSSSDHAKLTITALAPHGNLVDRYMESIQACFDMFNCDSVLNTREPSLNNNMISSGLIINFGKSTIVLGGDIEREAWEYVLKESTCNFRLEAQLVKVSHHGSLTGFCNGLWDRFSPQNKAYSVVTAFSKQGLPRREGLEYIRSRSSRLFTTSKLAIKPTPNTSSSQRRQSPFRSMAPDVVVALEATFNSPRISSKAAQGICSFILDDQGNTSHKLAGDAAEL